MFSFCYLIKGEKLLPDLFAFMPIVPIIRHKPFERRFPLFVVQDGLVGFIEARKFGDLFVFGLIHFLELILEIIG